MEHEKPTADVPASIARAAVQATANAVPRADAAADAVGGFALAEPDRLRLVMATAADCAFFTTDSERRVVSWNDGAERLFGWARDEAVGRRMDIIFTPEDQAAGEPEREAEAALTGRRVVDERWHQRKDGSRFWASAMLFPLRDAVAPPGAPPDGLLKVLRDRTGGRLMEEALREAEDHLRHTVELSPQTPWTADPDGRVNGPARGGEPERDWMRLTHPDDRPAAEAAWARSVSTGQAFDAEVRLRGADGLHRWQRIRALARRGPGGPERVVRWYGVLEDIHDRKAAEARLAALVDMGDRLRDLGDPADIGHVAADTIGRALGAARAGFAQASPDGQEFAGREWGDGVPAPVSGAEHRFRLSDFGDDDAAMLAEGRAVAMSDEASAPFRLAAVSGRRSVLAVPHLADGRLAAVAYAVAAMPRVWTDEESAFVRGAAARAWAAAERARGDAGRRLLIGELNHRVKNTLAVVQSLALQTVRGAGDLSGFTAAFTARLMALARAHDLLTRGNWQGAHLGSVVRAALEPVGHAASIDLGDCDRDGVLPPGQALALAMAVHELATNAAKHGALSVSGGRVAVACHGGPQGPVLEWVERGGPPVAGPPARQGFGLRLLSSMAGAAVDLRFEPAGLRCSIRLPREGRPLVPGRGPA